MSRRFSAPTRARDDAFHRAIAIAQEQGGNRVGARAVRVRRSLGRGLASDGHEGPVGRQKRSYSGSAIGMSKTRKVERQWCWRSTAPRPRPITERPPMQYLLMLYVNQAGWSKLTPAEQAQGVAAYSAYTGALTKAGVLKGANRLQATTAGAARPRPGQAGR